MASLYLIRHGQASFGQKNYDRLSDIGNRQAKVLGEMLVKRNGEFDALIAGEMERQQDTALPYLEHKDLVSNLAIDTGFNEYDSEGVFRTYLPKVYQDRPDLSMRHNDLFKDKALFKTCFNAVLNHWLNDTSGRADLESWNEFTQRVIDALDDVANSIGRNGKAAIFTSGGPICIAVGHVLGLDKSGVIKQTWLTRNGSITELHWGGSQPQLLGYNDVSHFLNTNDDTLITYR